ncbi:MAG: hypothetical protein HY360_12455 [Verrucomicrobia bacterium]|nr:hypothetical protein [Verrucomicrobiota bacterium]
MSPIIARFIETEDQYSGFKVVEKTNVTVEVRKPSWLTLRQADGKTAEPAAMDALTHAPPAVKAENRWLELRLPRLSLAQAVWIPNEKRKDGA